MTLRSFETSGNTSPTTQRYIPEDFNPQRRSGHAKPRNSWQFSPSNKQLRHSASTSLSFPVSSKSFRLLTARQTAVSPGISFVKESEICTQGCVQSLVCNKRPRSLLPGTLEPCLSLLVVCRSAWLGSEVCCQMVMAVVAAKVLETGVL